MNNDEFIMEPLADTMLKLTGKVLGDFVENKNGEMILSADKPVILTCGKVLTAAQAR